QVPGRGQPRLDHALVIEPPRALLPVARGDDLLEERARSCHPVRREIDPRQRVEPNPLEPPKGRIEPGRARIEEAGLKHLHASVLTGVFQGCRGGSFGGGSGSSSNRSRFFTSSSFSSKAISLI